MKLFTTHSRSALAAGSLLLTLSATASAQGIVGQAWGHNPGDYFGAAAARIGDLNGDGIAEYLVLAPGNNQPGKLGAALVMDGRFHYSLRTHQAPSVGSAIGGAVAGGVDWNQDGYPDYAVGFPRANVGSMNEAGMVRIYSGKDGSLLQTFFGEQAGMRLGAGLSFFGDVNGDGRIDLAVAAPNYAKLNADIYGVVRIYSGGTGMPIRDMEGSYVSNAGFGTVLVPAGDWNGDGVPDLVIGSPTYAYEGTPGLVQVFSGATGQPIFWLLPQVPGTAFGRSVAVLPDRDGDGRPELLVGDPGEAGVGSVRLLSSATKQTLGVWYGQAPNSQFGSAMAIVGDVDKDGYPDFAVTSPLAGPEALRVFSGLTGLTLWQPLLKQPTLPVLGTTVVALGDHDGDGWLNLLVTDSNGSLTGPLAGGAVVVRAALHHQNLGSQGPGNATLSVHGTPLTSGGTADLALATAGAHRAGFLVVSPWSNPTSLYGGTLVPTFNSLVLPIVTDANGSYTLKGIPGGLGLVSLYTQVVVENPFQHLGLGFSNAVRIDFMP